MAEPTTQDVADAFVQTYYKVLCNHPGDIHKFYLDSSTVSRLGADGVMSSFTTMEEIEKHVLSSLDCKEYDLLFFDVQSTANNGVFVVVVGRLTSKNDETVMRKFTQSFVLAPMEHVEKRYFVLNDIMRFLDEEVIITLPAEDAPAVSENSTQSDAATPDLVSEEHVSTADSSSTQSDESTTANLVSEEHVSTAILSSTQSDEATKDDTSEKVVLPKKSFLSVVNALTENNAPFKEPPVRKIIHETSQKARNLEINDKGTSLDKGTSVFVGRLTTETKPEELYESFKSFGPIKPNGVQIRTDKQNRLFAFIEFESYSSAQSAIQASFIRIGNRKLVIEEKKRNESGKRRFSQELINGNRNSNGQDKIKGTSKFNKTNGPAN